MINFEGIIIKGRHISGDEYGKFWETFDKAGVKASKLEFLQTYAFIDGNDDFIKGNYEKFLEMLKEFHKNAWGGKDNIRRIHYIEYPLNIYLEMEYYTYLINNYYGQQIKVTTKRELFPKKVYDFVLFENGNLFILDFGNNDKWNGAWHITDEKIIKKVSIWFNNVFDKCVDFKNMLKPNDKIICKMKKLSLI